MSAAVDFGEGADVSDVVEKLLREGELTVEGRLTDRKSVV